MYRAIRLANQDHDLHKFLWRLADSETIRDYRMTTITFGVIHSQYVCEARML